MAIKRKQLCALSLLTLIWLIPALKAQLPITNEAPNVPVAVSVDGELAASGGSRFGILVEY